MHSIIMLIGVGVILATSGMPNGKDSIEKIKNDFRYKRRKCTTMPNRGTCKDYTEPIDDDHIPLKSRRKCSRWFGACKDSKELMDNYDIPNKPRRRCSTSWVRPCNDYNEPRVDDDIPFKPQRRCIFLGGTCKDYTEPRDVHNIPFKFQRG